MSRFSCKSIPAVLLTGALLGGAYWLAIRPAPLPAPAPIAAESRPPGSPVRTVAADSRRVLPVIAPDGTARTAPALPSLDEALGLDSRLPHDRRLQVVHSLDGSELSAGQNDRLLAFVAETRLPAGLGIEQLRALKNDVLNILVAQKTAAPAVAELLRRIHADPAQDAGMRDYALQHLAALDTASGTGHAPQWQAIAGADSALAATALRQLHLDAREGRLSPDELTRLAQAASKLAADTTQPETSRSTALLICGQLKLPAARPLAYELARTETIGFPLRIAAVATLGDVGGDEMIRDYLQQLATGPERRLRIPAQSALKRISIN